MLFHQRLICVLLAAVCTSDPSRAQTAGDIVNVIGGLARSAIARATQAAWSKLSQAELTCIDENLHERGSSIASSIQQGVLPSDARLAEARSSCKQTSASRPPKSIYSVDGLNLYGRVVFDSSAYREYHCSPSQQYAGLTWCQKSRKDHTARGAFESYYSLLHSSDGTALYVNRELQPAWFTANEAAEDIERLTKKFGTQPKIIPIPQTQGTLTGKIAFWGNVSLEPLDAPSVTEIGAGHNVSVGLLVDHIGKLRRSAQLGLPIYRLAGGPGYVWVGSWDEKGIGSLQFLTVDASALTSGTIAPPSTPQIAITSKENETARPQPSNGAGDAYILLGQYRRPAVIGTIASSGEMCSVFSHPLFDLDPEVSVSVDPNHLASKWLLERMQAASTPTKQWSINAPSIGSTIEERLSQCLQSLPAKKYQSVANHFLTYLRPQTRGNSPPCYEQAYRTEQKLQDGSITSVKIPAADRTRCARFDFDGGSINYGALENSVFLAMLTLVEGHKPLLALLDQAAKDAEIAADAKRDAEEQARRKKEEAEQASRAAREAEERDFPVKGATFIKENPSKWEYEEEKDRMTGAVIAKVRSKQQGEGGAIAIVTGACQPSHDAVVFSALIVDDSGNPTIGITNRIGNNVSVRYRKNDRLYSGLLPWVDYKNNFSVLTAATDQFVKNEINQVVMLQAALAGAAPRVEHYKRVWGVLVEFKTAVGDLIVTIPTTDREIQKLYSRCFN